MNKNKMTRQTVPEDFTLGLALVDALPVLLFGVAMVLLGVALQSVPFILGATACFLSGAIKVLWKIIVVLRKKNVWWMFLQMRIVMPIGLLLMILSCILWGNAESATTVWMQAKQMPAVLFFGIGVAGMILMSVFAFVLDSSDKKSNWIEQLTNTFAQAAFLAGMLCLLI